MAICCFGDQDLIEIRHAKGLRQTKKPIPDFRIGFS